MSDNDHHHHQNESIESHADLDNNDDHGNISHDFSDSAFQLNQRSAQEAGISLDSKINFQALPVRAYLDQTVVPILLQGLAAVVRERPENPVEYLAAFLLKHNPQKSSYDDKHHHSDKREDSSDKGDVSDKNDEF
jgi:protein dpy-30